MVQSEETAGRREAISRLKAKRAVKSAGVLWIVIVVALVIIWAATGRGGFWPMWPMIGLAIAWLFMVYNAYFAPRKISESDIRREIDRDR